MAGGLTQDNRLQTMGPVLRLPGEAAACQRHQPCSLLPGKTPQGGGTEPSGRLTGYCVAKENAAAIPSRASTPPASSWFGAIEPFGYAALAPTYLIKQTDSVTNPWVSRFVGSPAE